MADVQAAKAAIVRDAIRVQMPASKETQSAAVGTLEIRGKRYPVSAHLAAALAEQHRLLEETEGAVQQNVKPGTEQMELLLQVGYGMDLTQAKLIISEREAAPASHPYDEYQRAKAMLAAYDAVPVVVSRREGWKREKVTV